MVPPEGFEPSISTLKGWRPGPLDDGGTRGTADSSGFRPGRQSARTNACSNRRTISSTPGSSGAARREKIPEIFLSGDVCSFGCASRAGREPGAPRAPRAGEARASLRAACFNSSAFMIFGLPLARRTSNASAEDRRRRLRFTAWNASLVALLLEADRRDASRRSRKWAGEPCWTRTSDPLLKRQVL